MNQQSSVVSATFSTEIEQQLLGAVLSNNNRFHEISGIVRPECFFDPVHGDIWRNVAARLGEDQVVTAQTLATELASHEGLNQLGGARYLANLIGASVGGFGVVQYAKTLSELFQRRTMADHFETMAADLRNGREATDVASEVELMMAERAEHSVEPRAMSFAKAQIRAIEQMHEVKQGNLRGIPTGLRTLDDVISLAPKRYTILGGQTSMGKTAMALHLAYSAAKAGHGVGFVTLEMPEEDLSNRINSIVSGLEYKTYDKPMSDAAFSQVIEAAKELQGLPLQVFSSRVRDVPAVLSEGKKLKHTWAPQGSFRGFRLLIIDYIQLMHSREKNNFERLSQIANDLKNVAKQLDVHVIALAQVDRSLAKLDSWDSWPAARPSLAHLRGSGDLENAPDNVLFIFRPHYFLTPPRCTVPTKPEDRADWEADYEKWKGKAELIVAKARMGEICSVTVGCDMGTNRFWDIDDGQERIEF